MKRLTHSFFDNMVIWYLFIATLCFGGIVIFTNTTITHLLVNERTASLQSQARLIATQYAKDYFDKKTTNIELNEQMISLQTLLNKEIWITDNNGQFIASSKDVNTTDSTSDIRSTKELPDNLLSLSSDISLNRSFSKTGTFHHMFKENTLSVGIPLIYHDKLVGYIIVHSSLSDLSSIKTGILQVIYLAFLVVLLSSLLFLYHFTKKVLNPLEQINHAAAQYSDGNFETTLQVSDKNEIGQLANSLNSMANELQQMEEYRRKFISNVSHDFRSPLTSIKGYLEAIQDGTIPPEKQEHYIDVVLNETKRLTKLTTGLLQLNDFNNNTTVLKKKIFNINETILKSIDTFEGTAIKKRVNILPDVSSAPLNVYADPDKINQVLYNLIDNALKFSKPDNDIFITALPYNQDKVQISVKDNGYGISEANQKHIWERFYKADSSRGRDKSGTGLGLAIVKEIIKSHDENITLKSKEGQGAEFTFTLPLAPSKSTDSPDYDN